MFVFLKKNGMKKIFTLTALLMLSLGSLLQAQDFYHGIGATYNLSRYNLAYTAPSINYNGTEDLGIPGLTYKATLNLADNISVSAYPSIGLSLNPVDSRFGLSVPVNAEFFVGDIEDNFFQVGAGFAYHYLTASSAFGGSAGGPVIGPEAAVSGQFFYQNQPLFLRAAVTYGVNSTKIPDAVITTDTKYLLSLSLIYPFGL
jgi:hypothetical protein